MYFDFKICMQQALTVTIQRQKVVVMSFYNPQLILFSIIFRHKVCENVLVESLDTPLVTCSLKILFTG